MVYKKIIPHIWTLEEPQMANPAGAEEGKRALTLTSEQEGLEDYACSIHLSLIRSISPSRGGWWPQAIS